tara:strand:+ start:1269 stop:2603 length:1335 start_codon:yes stop_codon:yes gene_type:complete
MTFNVLTRDDGVGSENGSGLSLSTMRLRDLGSIDVNELERELAARRGENMQGNEHNGDPTTSDVRANSHDSDKNIEQDSRGIPRKAGTFAHRKPKGDSQKSAASRTKKAPTTSGGESPEERFLHSTSPLPKSTYGRLNQLNDLPGFPNSPPVVLTTKNPKAYLFRNFLTAEECEHLMALAKKQLAPSTVVGTNGPVSSGIRTSAGTFLVKGQDEVVKKIENRMAKASGLPEPNGEGMQILRYDKGQKYDPHYDYFHDAPNSSPRRGGQRMATMLVYLADTESGGETIFPKAKKPLNFDDPEGGTHEWSECAGKSGIPVQSKRGDAVLFWSLSEDYQLDPGSLHGACPVVAGEKWTAVKWMRVAKFDGGFPADTQLPMPSLAISNRASGDGSHETTCLDEWDECELWAQKGYCTRNPEFMIGQKGARDSKGPACPQSCGVKCEEG